MKEQEHPMEVEDDTPYLDLEGDQEPQEYVLIKDWEFMHTPAYDADLLEKDLLEKICMDAELFTVWKAIRWANVSPIEEEGSRLLTIQFLCSLREV